MEAHRGSGLGFVTAIGGECSPRGEARFARDVLPHRPDVVVLDYGRNDVYLPAQQMRAAWRAMIERTLKAGAAVILVTPAPDCGRPFYLPGRKRHQSDEGAADVIRGLAGECGVALADAVAAFARLIAAGAVPDDFLISANHPNRAGHEVIARELARWFPLYAPAQK